jgi:hypothetical protein
VTSLPRRALTVLASFSASIAVLIAVFSGPAGASTSSYEGASELGLLPTLLLFIGGPIGLFVLIWLLVVAGQLSRRPKQENDMAWFREMPEDDAEDSGPPEVAGTQTPREIETASSPAPAPVSGATGSTRVTPGT